jgi:hypothetical protein
MIPRIAISLNSTKQLIVAVEKRCVFFDVHSFEELRFQRVKNLLHITSCQSRDPLLS